MWRSTARIVTPSSRAIAALLFPSDLRFALPVAHRGEDLALAELQPPKPAVAPLPALQKVAHDAGVEVGPAQRDRGQRLGEPLGVVDPRLQQVPPRRAVAAEERGRI